MWQSKLNREKTGRHFGSVGKYDDHHLSPTLSLLFRDFSMLESALVGCCEGGHHEHLQVDVIRAYYFGARFIVEVGPPPLSATHS